MRGLRALMKGSSWTRRAVAGVCILVLAGCVTTGTTETKATDADKDEKKQESASKPEELIWPLPPDPPRIKFLKEVSSEKDVGQEKGGGVMEALLGKDKKEGDKLRKPYGVHADRNGRIFVADTGWGKVLVFDFKNKKFDFWGMDGPGILSKPVAVTSDSKGHVYVSDVTQKRVVIYNENGEFVSAIGKKGEFAAPVGIAINEKLGRIYIVDTKKHHVAVFDTAGKPLFNIGKRGSKPGEFNFPTNLAMDGSGRVYVVDTLNFRVQIFDPDGKFIKTFGTVGDQPGQFARPKGIAVDSEGNIYVADAAFSNFQIFDPDGQLLLFVGSMGNKPGQFWLPAGAYIDDHDRLYVADSYNTRIQVFQRLIVQEAKKKAGP